METIVFWSVCSQVFESGMVVFPCDGFYKGKWIGKISVMASELVQVSKGEECLFWVEILSYDGDNMKVKCLKNFNQKLLFS